MRIVIEIFDEAASTNIVGKDSALMSFSAGSAPAVGKKKVTFFPSGRNQDAISGGAASTTFNATTDSDGGAAPL
jgi:hypothetical protein